MKMTLREPYELGPVLVNEMEQTLSYDGKSLPLKDQCFSLLWIWKKDHTQIALHRVIEDAARKPGRTGVTRSREIKSQLQQTLDRLGVPAGALKIEPRPGRGYKLILGQTARDTFPMFPKFHPQSYSDSGAFPLLFDGMLVNQVSELLNDDPETREIRSQCCRTYQRCIEDFAFAVVYSTSIYTSRTFRASLSTPEQPGIRSLKELGAIWKHFAFPKAFEGGSILNGTPEMATARKGIENDLKFASSAILSSTSGVYYRDWMVREATKYLGEDRTLFSNSLSADELKFNVDIEYYRDPELERCVKEAAIRRLVYAIRSAVKSQTKEVTDFALSEFVTRNLVSLISSMWERDIAAKPANIWHVPHVARSLIKLRSGMDGIPYQQHLRSLTVQHALSSGLREIGKHNRESILPALIVMRDEPPFRHIREILAEDGILIMRPSPLSEQKALRRIKQIRELTGAKRTNQDQVSLARESALRAIGQIRAADFERDLYRVFPELDCAWTRR